MGMVSTRDGTQIYYKDWGSGPAVVFSHGWPLTADAWEDQMVYLASRGYRVVAHDRRGHGRSSQPWGGNEMDTYADDLEAVLDYLDIRGAALIGHSTGGGEVTRYVGRHGTARVSRVVLVAAVPPLLVKTDKNPNGLPREAFEQIRGAMTADRSQFFRDLATPFYGFNRPGAKVSEGLREFFWMQAMMGSLKCELESVKAIEIDFTEDLKRFDVPTLIVHGDDDQIVPIGISSLESVKIVKDAKLSIYKGAPHGLASTHKEQLNAELLSFLEATAGARPSRQGRASYDQPLRH